MRGRCIWKCSRAFPHAVVIAMADEEPTRCAQDGKRHTLAEFREHYGRYVGKALWEEAAMPVLPCEALRRIISFCGLDLWMVFSQCSSVMMRDVVAAEALSLVVSVDDMEDRLGYTPLAGEVDQMVGAAVWRVVPAVGRGVFCRNVCRFQLCLQVCVNRGFVTLSFFCCACPYSL